MSKLDRGMSIRLEVAIWLLLAMLAIALWSCAPLRPCETFYDQMSREFRVTGFDYYSRFPHMVEKHKAITVCPGTGGIDSIYSVTR